MGALRRSSSVALSRSLLNASLTFGLSDMAKGQLDIDADVKGIPTQLGTLPVGDPQTILRARIHLS